MANRSPSKPLEIKADWAKLTRLFHELWGECKDGTYDKQKWQELHTEIVRAQPKAEAKDPLAGLFVVRLWDMFDGWIDITGAVTKAEADRVFNEKTNNGTQHTSFKDGDYYSVFPANTRMVFTAG